VASDSSRAKGFLPPALTILLLLSLSLRLFWALSRPADAASIDVLPDQREYLSIARNLLAGNGFEYFDPRFGQTVRAFRTPGYPLFLAACRTSVHAARAVQAVIDTCTVLAAFLLASATYREKGRSSQSRCIPAPPLLAAALVAFNPFLIYFSALLLSETLFTAMLAWAMVLLIWPRREEADRYAFVCRVSGLLLLALSVLVRPSAVALPVLLGIWSALVNRREPSAYQGVRRPAARRQFVNSPWQMSVTAAMLVLLSLLPWAVRNRNVLGRWIWLDTNSGFTLYDAYNPGATGASNQSFVSREPELAKLGEVDRSDYLAGKAKEYVRGHPGRVAVLIGKKLLRTWSPIPLSSEYGKPGLRLIALAYSAPFDILVLAGLIWGNVPRSAKVYLVAPAIYLSVVHALTVGSLRYRIPAEPALAVIAAGVSSVCRVADNRCDLPGRDR